MLARLCKFLHISRARVRTEVDSLLGCLNAACCCASLPSAGLALRAFIVAVFRLWRYLEKSRVVPPPRAGFSTRDDETTLNNRSRPELADFPL